MSPSYRYYLNALFDLELGAYPLENVTKSAAEMSVLFLPLIRPNDKIVLDVGVQDEYLGYLKDNVAIEYTESEGKRTGNHYTDIVWGWNEPAADRLSITLPACRSAAVITQINNRSFCHGCAAKYGFGVPGSHFCSTADDINEVFQKLSDQYPLVVKPAFGGSGFGFLILENRAITEKKRSTIEYYCEHGGCTIEPWCRRIADISSCVLIEGEDNPGSLLFHRQWINRFGAFYGIYIRDDDPEIERWRYTITQVSIRYAEDVAATGYRGPLGIDSFIYHNRSGIERCAAGIEINGRYTMGLLAHQIRRKLAPDKHILFRTVSKKRCSLPDTYKKLTLLLGKNQFDPEKKEGIILLTPLVALYRGKWDQPERSVFYVVGSSEQQITEFDTVLRRAVAPDKRYTVTN